MLCLYCKHDLEFEGMKKILVILKQKKIDYRVKWKKILSIFFDFEFNIGANVARDGWKHFL